MAARYLLDVIAFVLRKLQAGVFQHSGEELVHLGLCEGPESDVEKDVAERRAPEFYLLTQPVQRVNGADHQGQPLWHPVDESPQAGEKVVGHLNAGGIGPHNPFKFVQQQDQRSPVLVDSVADDLEISATDFLLPQ